MAPGSAWSADWGVIVAGESLVFMLEEPSAEAVLRRLLPHILPPNVPFQTIPHRGKRDLQKSLPRKLRAWQSPAQFIILHDQDSNNCRALKKELENICAESGRDNTVVRIACRELEAWYFGDLEALAGAFPETPVQKFRRKASYRADPDAIPKPAEALEEQVPGFQKGKAARTIPDYMALDRNRSHSFNLFVHTVKEIGEEVSAR